MAAATDTVLSSYRAVTEGCGVVDRSERGKLALTGPDAKAFLQGQVTNDIEGLEPGRGCYAAFLTHKGKMLGDLRVLDLGDELLLDTERSSLQELFNMIRRFKLGSDVELHKRTVEMGLLSVIGPGGAACRRRRGDSGTRSTTTRAPRSPAASWCSSRRTSAWTCSPRPRTPTRCGTRSTRRRPRGGRGDRACGVRTAALRRRPRRRGDPAGGRPQRAGGLVHQGLLRRPGDRRPALLSRQAQPAPARPRACPRRPDPATSCGSARRPSASSGTVVVSPIHGPIALALVRREAEPGATVAVGEGGAPAEVVELPFAV